MPTVKMPSGTEVIVERGPGSGGLPLLKEERKRCEIRLLHERPACEAPPHVRASAGVLSNCRNCPYRGEV